MILTKGSLWDLVVSTTAHALGRGALVPLSTRSDAIDDGSGIRFSVRILSSLERKAQACGPHDAPLGMGQNADPFLPPEPDLTVARVSETHVAVLNKFNVVDHHLLLVTADFEDQEMLLTREDFSALWVCLDEYESLGFYNGGREAGASQRHKHLQILPLPLVPGYQSVPLAPLLPTAEFETPVIAPALPFVHSFVRLGSHRGASRVVADQAFALYSAMLRHVGMDAAEASRPKRQSMPYCFLCTREWMLLVPRRTECFQDVSLNSLAFAGSLFVRDDEQFARLQAAGPMNALRAVTWPRGGW